MEKDINLLGARATRKGGNKNVKERFFRTNKRN